MPEPEVADVTLGAKYQAELVEAMKDEYYKYLVFFLKALNQDGYIAGQDPPKNKAEAIAAGSLRYQELVQRAQMGDTSFTVREQKFLMDQMELRRNGHAERQA